MKSFPFVVCLVIGVWVGYFLGIKKPPEPVPSEVASPKASTMELLESFQEENNTLRDRVAELEAELANYSAKEAEGLQKQAEEKEKLIESRLKKYVGLFDLTPDQKRQIGEIEWEFSEYWRKVRAGEINVKDNPLYDREEEISKVLTEEQREIFEAQLLENKDRSAALVATSHLGRYPVTLVLTDEQKGALHERLVQYNSPDTRESFAQRWKELSDRPYNRIDQQLLWAAEDVLDEEQMDALKQTLNERNQK